ncbi:MAG: nucleotidyltransferase family protein [Steroidobacteraceae bacterium]
MAIGGVLLAAGEARRMGGRPKALLRRDGIPLLRRNSLALLEAGVAPLVVVLGHRAPELAPHVADLPVEIVVAQDYALGKQASVRRGLAALPDELAGIVVALADQPALEVGDIRQLINYWLQLGGHLPVIPRVRGRRGNPVILPDRARTEVLAAPSEFGCRDWLDQHEALSWLDADQDGYVLDVDSEEDLERLRTEHGLALTWE